MDRLRRLLYHRAMGYGWSLLILVLLAATLSAACLSRSTAAPEAEPSTGTALRSVPVTDGAHNPATNAQPASSVSTQPRPKLIALDPGHGGPEVGAVHRSPQGTLAEKDSNLDMAFRLRALLIESGYQVILTRETDARAAGDLTGPTTAFPAARLDLQHRIDMVNEAGADLFISLHSNGSPNAGESGLEVWYDPNRPFGADNVRLATLVQRRVLAALAAYGYWARDRGIKDDTTFRFFNGRYLPLFVLGPPRETRREEILRRGGDPELLGFSPGVDVIMSRATEMPGVLVEMLFLTNDADAAVLRDPAGRDAIARGIRDAIEAYFAATD